MVVDLLLIGPQLCANVGEDVVVVVVAAAVVVVVGQPTEPPSLVCRFGRGNQGLGRNAARPSAVAWWSFVETTCKV